MYSTWWKPKPKGGDEETQVNPTDHDALNRDEATHKMIQADEEFIRPLDLETVMSSKAAVKYWYLHRPKQMAAIHKKSVIIQSAARSWAVRRLIDRNGVAFTVNLAKLDAEKKEAARLAELSEAERLAEEKAEAEAEAMRQEKRRLREEAAMMEKVEAECREAEAVQAKLKADEERRIMEELSLMHEEERMQREQIEKELIIAQAAILAAQQEEEARLQAEREAEEARLKAEREAEDARRAIEAAAEAAAEAQRRAILESAAAVALAPTVPVTTPYGLGTVVSYTKETGIYEVRLDEPDRMPNCPKDGLAALQHHDLMVDESRIYTPSTLVDTPFGLGEIVSFDGHTALYTIAAEVAPEGKAFVHFQDVHVHDEKATSVILEDAPNEKMPEEIGLLSARIVDSRIASRAGKKYVQYKLEIQTTNYGTVYCWKRYNMFRDLCTILRKEKGFKKKEIPELPKRHILGNFSEKTIGERTESLNIFLDAAVKAEHLQWGIKVDDTISVYKRRVKRRRPHN